MYKSVTALFICFVFSNPGLYAQVVDIHGKVVDSISGKGLAAVSIVIDKYRGAITNNKGEFHCRVEQALFKDYGLTCSYVGYKKKHIQYNENVFIHIVMALADNEISEVTVYGDAKPILVKAIDRIGLNYPATPFVQKAIFRVYNIVGDSDYFYKADAAVEAWFPPYTEHGKPVDIKVIQNRQLLLKNPNSAFQQAAIQTKWVGGFNSIPDIVHTSPDYINKDKLANYQYRESDKIILEGRKVFAIEFNSKTKKGTEGTLYIDTATYAFVGADVTRYNIHEFGFVPISVSRLSVRYQLIGGKWYVKNAHAENKHVYKIDNNNYIKDYAAVSTDTTNAPPFSYNDIIQRTDENIKIIKPGNTDSWKMYDSIFIFHELTGSIGFIPVPGIDTTLRKVQKKKIGQGIFQYLRGDNVREALFVSKLPLKINLPPNKSALAGYGFGFDIRFRIYKSVFVKYEWISNLGAGGINISQTGVYLSYLLGINKHHRPVSVSPLFGYNNVRFSINHQSGNGYSDNLAAGISAGIELTHKKEFFVAGMQNGHLNKISGLSVQQAGLYISMGIQFKL